MKRPERHKVAVIGCGEWGRNLVRNFAQLGSLAMVCDIIPAARRVANELAPQSIVTADLDDVMSPEVAGVVIATPAETHFELAAQALIANKDVLVEKPLSLSYDQGARLVRLAQERGRILMVGHVLEYHPAITRLVEMVLAGELGRVYYIYSNRVSLGRVRREENSLWSFAPHDLAVILRLTGSMPLEVITVGGSYLQPEIADVTVTHPLFDRACEHMSTCPGCTLSRSKGWL